jgi:hypothetical protein
MHDVVIAQRETQAAYQALKGGNFGMHPRGNGVPLGFIEQIWAECLLRMRAQSAEDHGGQIAAAREATKVLRAIGSLDIVHWNALGDGERRAQSGRAGHFPEEHVAFRAAIASHPDLAAFYVKIDERAAQMAANHQETLRLQAEQRERDAPTVLLAALRLAGIDLALSADGKHLVLPPAQMAKLTREELDEIKLRRPALVALLKADAEAARPVVVA